MRAAIVSLIAASFVLACGKGEPPPASPEASHEEEHEEHGTMKPALHDFHEVLAPLWHAPPGMERVGKTCKAQGDLGAKAAAVGDAELSADTDAVKAACEKPGQTDVEAKLGVVHERFHKLVEAKP